MAARTTQAQLALIIELDATILDVSPFISVANEIVTEMCTGDNAPTPAYTSNRLELIERWLAAHFYAIRDPRTESEKAGPVGAKYQSKVDLGFDVSHYGQMAMRLDTNGKLSALNSKIKNGGKSTVSILWMGTSSSSGS